MKYSPGLSAWKLNIPPSMIALVVKALPFESNKFKFPSPPGTSSWTVISPALSTLNLKKSIPVTIVPVTIVLPEIKLAVCIDPLFSVSVMVAKVLIDEVMLS